MEKPNDENRQKSSVHVMWEKMHNQIRRILERKDGDRPALA